MHKGFGDVKEFTNKYSGKEYSWQKEGHSEDPKVTACLICLTNITEASVLERREQEGKWKEMRS